MRAPEHGHLENERRRMSLVISLVLGTLGLFFLLRGKKTMNPGMMIVGGILLVLSYVLF